MATLTGGPAGIEMSPSTTFETIKSVTLSPTEAHYVYGDGDTGAYSGTFTYSGDVLESGTATGYQEYDSAGLLIYQVTGISVPVSVILADYESKNFQALEHSIFTGGDTYQGTSGNDVFIGIGGNDTFIGGTGVDTFEPGIGSNTITGGNAEDSIAFSGNASQYSIAAVGSGPAYTVTATSTGQTSVNHVSNVEFVQFADRMVFVCTPAEAQIALLYQGALGRTPDVPGLVGWQNAFATEPLSAQGADNFTSLAGTPVSGLPDLAYGFTTSTEFQQKYGSLTNAQYVTQLYANVLDRAPDTAGLDGWVNALAAGHTREWVLVGFVESPEAYSNAEMGYVGQTGTVHAPWLVVT